MTSADPVRNPANLKLVLYVDFGSQPARAIAGFCKLNGIAHELKMVPLRKREHMKEPFISINPREIIPAMQELDASTGEVVFTLSESHTILRYLADSRMCPDHWYPREDLKKRAIVDAYLD